MIKSILRYTYLLFTGSMLICLNSCFSPTRSGSGGSKEKPSYSTNIEQYKVKEQGNKIFYKLPVATAVEIKATIGNRPVIVDWSMTNTDSIEINEKNGLKLDHVYNVISRRPSTMTIKVSSQASGNSGEVITKNQSTETSDKIFILEWFVPEGQERTNITFLDLQISHNELNLSSGEFFSEGDKINLKNGCFDFVLGVKNSCDKLIDLGKVKIRFSIDGQEQEFKLSDNPCYLAKGEAYELTIKSEAFNLEDLTVETQNIEGKDMYVCDIKFQISLKRSDLKVFSEYPFTTKVFSLKK
jgi:hypothetical protein